MRTCIFLSYKYTGVPLSTLEITVKPLVSKIRQASFEVFCNLERDNIYVQERWTPKMIMDEALHELDKCTYHITFVAPNTTIGEGMLIELGYAKKMGLPTLLLIPEGYKSISARAVCDNVIEYTSMNDLCDKLAKFSNT